MSSIVSFSSQSTPLFMFWMVVNKAPFEPTTVTTDKTWSNLAIGSNKTCWIYDVEKRPGWYCRYSKPWEKYPLNRGSGINYEGGNANSNSRIIRHECGLRQLRMKKKIGKVGQHLNFESAQCGATFHLTVNMVARNGLGLLKTTKGYKEQSQIYRIGYGRWFRDWINIFTFLFTNSRDYSCLK